MCVVRNSRARPLSPPGAERARVKSGAMCLSGVIMRGTRIPETRRARDLRAAAPSAETKIWSRLRNGKLGGFKFTRQEPIGPWFVDFVCRERRLIIEIDGATHSTDEERARDARRAEALIDAGFEVVRFNNADVFQNLDGVAESILARLEKREFL
jgi:very-short-patch-repair endonuclease